MRRLAPLFLLWLAVDFSNPMLPGSVQFETSESVEATHAGVYPELDGRALPAGRAERLPPTEPLQSLLPRPVGAAIPVGSRPPTARHRPRESDARTSASPLEDH